VQIDAAGNMTGYAWSSNIGWIKFGGLNTADMPTIGSTRVNAYIGNTYSDRGKVYGWIRACAGTVNKDCNSATRTDGWDGWIELSGTNHISPNSSGYYDSVNWSQGTSTQGVTVDPVRGKFSGYAWGGDVVGWIDFNPRMTAGTPGTIPGVSCPTCYGVGTPITGTCTIPTQYTLSGNEQNLIISNTRNIVSNLQGVTGTYTVSPSSLTIPKGIYPSGYWYLTVTDSTTNSGTVPCNAITVKPAQLTGPRIKFSDKEWPGLGEIQSKTVRIGESVTLNYEFNKGSLLCSGIFNEFPATYPIGEDLFAQNWQSPNIIDSSSDSYGYNGSFTFENLVKGTYKILLTCDTRPMAMIYRQSWIASIIGSISSILALNNSGDSNILKITVTKTSAEEI